jgi:hypothetical protein
MNGDAVRALQRPLLSRECRGGLARSALRWDMNSRLNNTHHGLRMHDRQVLHSKGEKAQRPVARGTESRLAVDAAKLRRPRSRTSSYRGTPVSITSRPNTWATSSTSHHCWLPTLREGKVSSQFRCSELVSWTSDLTAREQDCCPMDKIRSAARRPTFQSTNCLYWTSVNSHQSTVEEQKQTHVRGQVPTRRHCRHLNYLSKTEPGVQHSLIASIQQLPAARRKWYTNARVSLHL